MGILDYGSGNLFSIENALRKSSPSVDVKITSKLFLQSEPLDGLILPGVGSFSSAQRILSENRKEILKFATERVPILGICLGMQLLFEKSEEGSGEGLKLFAGTVKRFSQDNGAKVPHMGWNSLSVLPKSSRLCAGMNSVEWVYYVHSFFPVPKDKTIVHGVTNYAGESFPSIVESENVFGTQFHPEKSGSAGARLISNFTSLCNEYGRS